MNDLMQEIMKATAMVNAMETEVTAAAKELENEVAANRKEKSRHIVEFVYGMHKALYAAKYPKNQRMIIHLPWSVKEFGQFNNYRWTIALRLATVDVGFENMVFGRYYVGSRAVCEEVVVNPVREEMAHDHAYGTLVYSTVVDNWSEKIEAKIEEEVAKAVKQTLEKRMATMTERLNKATEEHKKVVEG